MIASFLEAVTAYYIVGLFTQKRFIFLKYYQSILLLTMIIFSKVLSIELNYINGLVGIIFIYFSLFLLIKDDFKLNYHSSFKKTLLVLFIMIISELLIGAVSTMLGINYNEINLIERFIFSISATSSNILLTIIISFLFLEKHHKLKVEFSIGYMFLLHILAFALALFIYYLAIENNIENHQFFLYLFNVFLLIILTVIIYSNLYQIKHLKQKELILNDYVESFKNMLKNQRKLSHEHVNDLIIIKTFLKNNNHTELLIYIEEILDAYKLNDYQQINNNILQIKYEQIQNVLLYKLIKLESLNIKYFLNIVQNKDAPIISNSKEIVLAKIIAIFFDNIIENHNGNDAVLIEFEIEPNQLIITLSNQFKKNNKTASPVIKGIGLSLVQKFIYKNDIKIKTQVVNNTYVQQIITKHH